VPNRPSFFYASCALVALGFQKLLSFVSAVAFFVRLQLTRPFSLTPDENSFHSICLNCGAIHGFFQNRLTYFLIFLGWVEYVGHSFANVAILYF
jgi:hypothetical protein